MEQIYLQFPNGIQNRAVLAYPFDAQRILNALCSGNGLVLLFRDGRRIAFGPGTVVAESRPVNINDPSKYAHMIVEGVVEAPYRIPRTQKMDVVEFLQRGGSRVG